MPERPGIFRDKNVRRSEYVERPQCDIARRTDRGGHEIEPGGNWLVLAFHRDPIGSCVYFVRRCA